MATWIDVNAADEYSCQRHRNIQQTGNQARETSEYLMWVIPRSKVIDIPAYIKMLLRDLYILCESDISLLIFLIAVTSPKRTKIQKSQTSWIPLSSKEKCG